MTFKFLIKNLLFTLVVHWSNSWPLSGDRSSIKHACSELAGCEQGCVLNNNKPQCFCYPGYTLQTNGQSCKTTRSPQSAARVKNNVPISLSDVFTHKEEGCRGDMCRNVKFYPEHDRKPNFKELCPPNFRSVVTNGVRVCVDPSNINNFPNPKVKNTSHKKQNLNRKLNISMSEKLFRIARQNAKKELYRIPEHNSSSQSPQHLAIIRKYSERQQRPRCQNDEVLVPTVNGVVCRKQCEPGQVVREEQGIKTCVNLPFKITDNPCPEGHRPTQTTIGIVCEKHSETKIGNIQAGKPLCTAGERLVHLQTGPVCISSKSRRPVCKDGEDLVQLRKEFYCVLSKPEVKPKCNSQEEEKHSDQGTECRPKACADGLIPVKTPVGTVCQFDSQSIPAVETKQCAPGQTLITTEDGPECWFISDSKKREIICPPGQVLVGGTTCKDPMLISPDEVSCPLGQELVMTLNGAECQYRRSQSNELQHTHITRCPEREVLTLESDKFVCYPTEHDLTDVICDAGHVIVQGHTNILECVSEEQTNLVCEFGLVLTRTVHGYLCEQHTKTGSPVPISDCGPGQALVVEGDRKMCVGVENNVHLCGPGHEAVLGISGEVICRASPTPPTESSDVIQPCSEEHCFPGCLNGGACVGGKCQCADGFSGSLCQEDVNECVKYSNPCEHRCRNTYGSFFCTCPQGSRLREDKRTCQSSTCNPNCINGGRCLNNRCRCAPGYYGIICQLDIDECYLNPCEHKCVNTIGSYYCASEDRQDPDTNKHT
ncbi:fibropellin-1-like isoform X3 [Ostrea edulis]|uniref:fibropellin-1-like isoform X3 n=1 Tax=Ostrea edulis TaxID=37623 RepID=UPI002095FF34|nr:fibropellin-1-like isoform X3 [Ostrea edulis]